MCSDCEAYGLKKHGLTRSDYYLFFIYGADIQNQKKGGRARVGQNRLSRLK